MEFENIMKLVKCVSDSNLTRFSYEESGWKLEMRTDKEQTPVGSLPEKTEPQPLSALTENLVVKQEKDMADQTEPVASEKGKIVKSPLVGTFYAAPSPDEEPFVKPGDTVKKGQVLGIVEAMKLMNEIESDFDGVVKEIMVSNEEVIEFDQPMFVIVEN